VVRLSAIAVYVYSLVFAGVPEVVVVVAGEERVVEEGKMGVTMERSKPSKGTPTCYILNLSFLLHCLNGNAMLQSCRLHQASHQIVRNRESPPRASREPGEVLAKASRIHFSVPDLVVIGCRHVKERLS